jgi:WD40 repeat protein
MKDGKTVVFATASDIYFAQEGVTGTVLKKSSGWLIKDRDSDNQDGVEFTIALCVGYLGYDAIVGSIDGQIIRFKGTNVFEAKDAHNGSCNCIFTRPDESGFLSGGSDAKILIWNSKFEKQKEIDARNFDCEIPLINPRIRALFESPDKSQIIVGTRSGSIFKLNNEGKAKQVHSAHSDNELWGLCAVPNKEEIITCAGDNLLIKWDIKNKKATKCYHLDYTAACCDVSSDGNLVAVGCQNGYLIVIDCETFSIVKFKKKDRFKEINVVKFSPNNQFLAVGASDNSIILYRVNGWQNQGMLGGHKSPVIKIDWSADSQYIHSNGYHLENLFFKVESRTLLNNGIEITKSTKWATWTCLFGWQTIGIWTPNSTGMDINATCRSQDGQLLVTGDDYGRLKIFKFPSFTKNANHFNIHGHASYISNVCFNTSGNKLFSLGQIDNTIMQWGVEQRKIEDSKVMDTSGFDESDLDTFKKVKLETQILAEALQISEINPKMGMFDLASIERGDQLLAEKPFKKQAEKSTPDNYQKSTKSKEPPEGSLFLRHIFGYRSFDCKGNLFFLGNSDMIVFSSAAVPIVMNTDSKEQKFFNYHNDDLVAMDVSKNKQYCVTGSVCSQANANENDYLIWDTTTMMEAGRVTEFHAGSVKLVKFSLDSTMIASVGKDEPHKLAIHDWRDNRLLCSSIVDHNSVFDIDWLDKTHLVTVGKTHIKFWSIKLKSLTSYNGSWEKFKPTPLICCKYGKEACYTGASNGDIGVWVNCIKKTGVKAHDGTVFCLFYQDTSEELYSGGKDGLVKVWKISGENLSPLKTIFDAGQLGDPDKEFIAVRTLDRHSDGSTLIGTRNSKIIKLSSKGNEPVVLMDSHYEGNLSCLAVHPQKPLFITAASDKTLRLWNPLKRTMEKKLWVDHEIIALDWSSNGEYIIAGSISNELFLFDSNLNKLFEGLSHFAQKKGYKINTVKFNPENSKIAVGALGVTGEVEFLEIGESYKLKRLCVVLVDGHGGIINMDWAAASNYLMVNTESQELKFIKVDTNQIISPTDAKNIEWATWTCQYGYATLGVFPTMLGEDVNSVCRNKAKNLIATGDDLQNVSLFRFPAVQTKCGCKKYVAHSAPVAALQFILEDHGLISIGGRDKSIILWNTDFGDDTQHKEEWLHGTGISYDP